MKKKIYSDYPYKHVTWECTNVCNFSCSYCWPDLHSGTHRWPNEEKTSKLVNYLKNFSDNKIITLDIMGGEPTLWPHLEDFCNNVGSFCKVYFSTNGSRTARYWNNFNAPLNELYFSFHPEQSDPEIFLKNVEITSKKYHVSVYILLHPLYRDICTDLYDKLYESDYPIRAGIKKINGLPMKYSQEEINYMVDKKFDRWQTKNDISFKVYRNGREISLDKFTKLGHNRFKGWTCTFTQNYRYIKYDGTIYGAACSRAGQSPFGNVFEDEIKQEPITSVVCDRDSCNCKTDIIMAPKKIINKRLPNVRTL